MVPILLFWKTVAVQTSQSFRFCANFNTFSILLTGIYLLVILNIVIIILNVSCEYLLPHVRDTKMVKWKIKMKWLNEKLMTPIISNLQKQDNALLQPSLHPWNWRIGFGGVIAKPKTSTRTAQVQRECVPLLEDDHNKLTFAWQQAGWILGQLRRKVENKQILHDEIVLLIMPIYSLTRLTQV